MKTTNVSGSSVSISRRRELIFQSSLSCEPHHSHARRAAVSFQRNGVDRLEVSFEVVYTVFKLEANGEYIEVGSCGQREEALQLVKAFSEHWPGEYLVRDSEGNELPLR